MIICGMVDRQKAFSLKTVMMKLWVKFSFKFDLLGIQAMAKTQLFFGKIQEILHPLVDLWNLPNISTVLKVCMVSNLHLGIKVSQFETDHELCAEVGSL